MGRGYKTTASSAVDYMYELPKELMMGAIASTDKKIDTEITSADEAQKKLDLVKNLKGDNEFVNQRYSEYDSQITNLAEQIRNDPMAYKKLGGEMRKVSRTISEDMTRGGLFRAQENYDKMQKYKDEVNANKEFTEERKKQLIDASELAYKNLNFQSPDNYNDISKNLIAGYKHIDEEDFLNKVQQGWATDRTAWNNAQLLEEGGVKTVSGSREVREEASVEKYLRGSLKSSGISDDIRQGFELDQQLGNLDPETDVEALIKAEEDRFIAKGKEKLGYKNTSSSTTYSGVKSYGQDVGGTGAIDADIRNNAGDKAIKQKIATYDLVVNAYVNKNGKFGNFSSLDDMVNSFSNPTTGKTFGDAYKAFTQNGFFVGKKEEFVNWANGKLREKIKYVPLPQSKINTYNNRDMNTSVKAIYKRDSEENRTKTELTSLGDLYENNAGNEYLYTPVKDTDTINKGLKKVDGFLVDKNGVFFVDKTNKKVTNVSNIDQNASTTAGTSGGPVMDIQQVYVNKGNMQNATTGSFRAIITPTIDGQGKIQNDTSYVQTEQVYRINSITGEYEVMTLDIEIDPNTMPNN